MQALFANRLRFPAANDAAAAAAAAGAAVPPRLPLQIINWILSAAAPGENFPHLLFIFDTNYSRWNEVSRFRGMCVCPRVVKP